MDTSTHQRNYGEFAHIGMVVGDKLSVDLWRGAEVNFKSLWGQAVECSVDLPLDGWLQVLPSHSPIRESKLSDWRRWHQGV